MSFTYPLFPAFWNLSGKSCLVVGGGPVAERRVLRLLHSNASVHLIAPTATQTLERLSSEGRIRWTVREFQTGDTTNYALIVAATSSASVNRAVSSEAKNHDIPVNVVDDPENGDLAVGAVLNFGSITVALTTNGEDPSLSKKLRQALEHDYETGSSEFVRLLRAHKFREL